MKTMKFIITVALLHFSGVLLIAGDNVAENKNILKAEEFLQMYQDYEMKYNPEIADLYNDTASIKYTEKMPDGTNFIKKIYNGTDYKKHLKIVVPNARNNRIWFRWRDVSFTPTGDRVWIEASRQEVKNNIKYKINILVGPDNKGNWRIYEEVNQLE